MAKPKFTKAYLDKLQEFVGKDMLIEKVEIKTPTAWIETAKVHNQNAVRKLRGMHAHRTGKYDMVFVLPNAKQVWDEYHETPDVEDEVSYAEFTTLSFTDNGFTIGLEKVRLTYVKYVPPRPKGE